MMEASPLFDHLGALKRGRWKLAGSAKGHRDEVERRSAAAADGAHVHREGDGLASVQRQEPASTATPSRTAAVAGVARNLTVSLKRPDTLST